MVLPKLDNKSKQHRGRWAIQSGVLTVAFTVGGGKVAGVTGGAGEFEVTGTVDAAWLGDACNGRARRQLTGTEKAANGNHAENQQFE